MYYLHVSSNIMSLGGLALAIGVLVDAAIVMVENGYRHLAERQSSVVSLSSDGASNGPVASSLVEQPATTLVEISEPERRRILLDSAKQVGPAIFFSLVIIVVSFLPVFLLEAQEGRLFRPLAWTKTLAVGFSSILAITLVPVLMVLFIRGRLTPESKNPISRITQAIYLPILRLCLRFRKTTLLLNLLFLVVTLPIAFHIGSQFMPTLFEGSSLYMPTSLPGISITQASQLLQEQDEIIRTFPEVETVFGTVGRSDSPTDNTPLDMYDTTIMLKPRAQWRREMTYEKLVQEMDAKLQFPGLSNTWTMPVENRLDMELTGIKTPLGLKIQGPNLEGVQQVGAQVQQILSAIPEMRSIFAERVSQGFYLNIEVNRAEAARYGLTVADVQQAVTSGIGGEMIAENVEGRERYPVNVRYGRDFRDNIEELQNVLIGTPSGAQIPISEVAKLSFSRGPAMIRDEDGALTGYVYIDLNTSDYGGFVSKAGNLLRQKLALPPGFTYKWSGEYEFELRAKQRLELILPVGSQPLSIRRLLSPPRPGTLPSRACSRGPIIRFRFFLTVLPDNLVCRFPRSKQEMARPARAKALPFQPRTPFAGALLAQIYGDYSCAIHRTADEGISANVRTSKAGQPRGGIMSRRTKSSHPQKDKPDHGRERPLPNRTSDESPAGGHELTQRIDLRDPISAPGQLPPSDRGSSSLAADERYGNTEIPRGHETNDGAGGSHHRKVSTKTKRSEAKSKP